ncbi:PREDICTED: probable aquaporin TIP5-1 [Tarenaya hassleriana]|uniref:probable aquaporin TIP5-1 n=1 Tax=Tarenaya hassleriana TaxID=28532 RepID=UPI00053C4703|nr:PREDICTED: probable aquaporin TIP5-1 [Tarenaya hassleriana]
MIPISLSDRFRGALSLNALRCYLAEFISTFFFVLAAVGSIISSRKSMAGDVTGALGVLTAAIATAFALSSAVYIAWNVSGGHVNPAVTFGMVVAGRISVPTALFYWTSQMFASVMACLVLKVTVFEQHVAMYKIAAEMTGFGASVLEGVMTFALVYTVCSAGDPRRGPSGVLGPIFIGFVAGANVLAAGPFSGGSMNPACAFGSALVYGSFKNQAVYWVGPLLGGAFAALVYDNLVAPADSDRDSLSGDSAGV